MLETLEFIFILNEWDMFFFLFTYFNTNIYKLILNIINVKRNTEVTSQNVQIYHLSKDKVEMELFCYYSFFLYKSCN